MGLHNPEPASVVTGRPFLYDALDFSSNGEASCSSCHIFGNMDDLAWDLGNPDNPVTSNPTTTEFQTINLSNVAGLVTLPIIGSDTTTAPKLNGSGNGDRLPSDEGSDDDPDPSRHGQQRRHALARRPRRPGQRNDLPEYG